MCSKSCFFDCEEGNTFRCLEHGTRHVCDNTCVQTFVSEHGTVTCLWTGKCFEQRQQDHPFARVATRQPYNRHECPTTRKRKRQRNPFQNLKTEKLMGVSRTVLRCLLYSTTREEQNTATVARAKKHIRKEIKRYQRRSTPSTPSTKKDIEQIIHKGQPVMLPIQAFDADKCQHYGRRCLRYWHYLATTEHAAAECSHIRFLDMVVAFLFLMRKGLRFEDGVVIPPDPFLADMLPTLRNLKHFGIANKGVTTAKNQFLSSIRLEYRKHRLPFPLIPSSDHVRPTSPNV